MGNTNIVMRRDNQQATNESKEMVILVDIDY